MNHNLLPSDRAAVVAAINPASLAAAGTASTGWVSLANYRSLLAVVMVGAMTATGTLDAKLQQAKDASGTGAKDITGKAITQLTAAGTDDNKQALINVRAEDLDVNNEFTHVRLTVAAATAASLIAGLLLGFDDKRYGSASADDAATVDEIVA